MNVGAEWGGRGVLLPVGNLPISLVSPAPESNAPRRARVFGAYRPWAFPRLWRISQGTLSRSQSGLRRRGVF